MQLDLENLSGALFKNTYKTPGSNQPDYKGMLSHKITKEKILEVAAWETTSRDGNTTYLSLKLSEPFQKNQQPSNPPAMTQQPQRQPEMDAAIYEDDIPF